MKNATLSNAAATFGHGQMTCRILMLVIVAIMLIAPLAVYPLFLIKILCFVLFAAAFNLVLGYAGLLSFGHAAFFGGGAYIAAQAAKVWQWPFDCRYWQERCLRPCWGLPLERLPSAVMASISP